MAELPAEHQFKCPYALVELQRPLPSPADDEAPASAFSQLTCPDRRCCVWLDLRSWFGLDTAELPINEFRLAFTDIAHGGSGLYEKLIVLGHRALETFSEMYIYEQFDPTGIPSDLLGGREIPEEITRSSWTRKRVERLMSPHSFYSFSKAYLSTAQSLPTQISCVKFVKACVGYSVQLPDLETRRLFEWMPTLVEHVYWAQRLRNEEQHEEDNETLQDIQEYFGYPYSRLIPRIREALATDPAIASESGIPTGRQLIRFFAFDYFRSLADETEIPLDRRAAWISDETEHFMKSLSLRLFAACWLNLGPYMALLSSNTSSLPHSSQYAAMFEALLSACYVLSSEEKSRIWVSALIHRLRQIQLTIRLRELDLLTGGPTATLENLQGIDIHRWSSLSHMLQHRLLNWTLAGLDDISVSTLQAPGVIPPDLLRQAEKEGINLPISIPEQSQSSTLIDELKSICFPCLKQQKIDHTIKLIQSPSGSPLDLIQTGKLYKPLHKDTILPDRIQLNPKSVPNQKDNFWETLTYDKGPKSSNPGLQAVQHNNQVPNIIHNNNKNNQKSMVNFNKDGNSMPLIFKRHRHPRDHRAISNFDCWKSKIYDSHGAELWRPPGAILMKRRKLGGAMKSTLPHATRKEHHAELLKSSPPILTSSTATTSSTESSDMKLDIHYVVPSGASPANQPIQANLYANEKDMKHGNPPEMKAVLEMNPENRQVWNMNQNGPEFKATLYRNPHTDVKEKPIQIEFVPKGSTGSPRVYISAMVSIVGPMETKTMSGKSTIMKGVRYKSTDNNTVTNSSQTTTISEPSTMSELSSTLTSISTQTSTPSPSIISKVVHEPSRRIPSNELVQMSPLLIAPKPVRVIPLSVEAQQPTTTIPSILPPLNYSCHYANPPTRQTLRGVYYHYPVQHPCFVPPQPSLPYYAPQHNNNDCLSTIHQPNNTENSLAETMPQYQFNSPALQQFKPFRLIRQRHSLSKP